jgi:hypothetical protein
MSHCEPHWPEWQICPLPHGMSSAIVCKAEVLTLGMQTSHGSDGFVAFAA